MPLLEEHLLSIVLAAEGSVVESAKGPRVVGKQADVNS